MSVRLRMAPSPTGYLHVGTARTALFNWLHANHHGGTFIVRVDDTDFERSTKEYEEEILSSFRWLGLDWDEGVGVGGPHGSYRQSDRLDRYQAVAQKLVESGAAYYDQRPSAQLDGLRARAQSEGRHPGHYIRRPDTVYDSGVIRLAIPEGETVVFDDVIRGTVRFESEALDDFVILRSEGTPTYHLASTVDDIDYEITHVARGEDLLPSTPKHILLTRAMGESEPRYAHLPLLLGTDGKKLSKRHGATALTDYRNSGILPEAMFNYLAILGWSLDAQTTIFTREQALASFDLSDVSRNPAAFDPEKLLWMNGEYVRAMDVDHFNALARPWVELALGRELLEDEWHRFEALAEEVQERTKLLPEIGEQVRFLFEDIDGYDPASWSKVMEKGEVPEVLEVALARLSNLNSWDAVSIESTLREIPEELGIGAGKAFQPLRVAVTGSSVSPPLFESMAALGRQPHAGPDREGAARVGLTRARVNLITGRGPVVQRSRTPAFQAGNASSNLVGTTQPDAVQVLVPPHPTLLRGQVESTLGTLGYILGILAVTIGVIAIGTAVLLSVLERRHEIGVRRTLGATGLHIAAQVLVESFLMGLVGGLIGTIIGVAAVVLVATQRGWVPIVPTWTITAAAAGGAVIGILAGILPSLRAARIEPIEVLRA